MHNLKDILSDCDPLVVVLESNTKNNQNPARYDADMLGGIHGHDGVDTSIAYESDANISFSYGTANGLNTSRVLSKDLQVTNNLPAPFSGLAGGSTVSTFNIEHAATENSLDSKIFDNTDYTLKVGGTIYKGESNEENIHYNDYKTWSSGRITSYSLGSELKLSASRLPTKLLNQFPVNTHTYGKSEGLAKDFLIGSHRNHQPKPVADGLHDFHDGIIGQNTDQKINMYPVACFENGEVFGNISFSAGATPDISYGLSDFDWEVVNNQQAVSDNLGLTVNASLDKKTANFSIENNSLIIKNDVEIESVASVYDFRWTVVDSRTLVSSGKYPVYVRTSGDLIIRPETSYWFKLTGPDTAPSQVFFDFHKPVARLKIVARNVNTNITIDTFTIEPDSIQPPYGLGVNSSILIERLGAKSFGFNFKGNGIFGGNPSGNLVAFWIEEVEFYEPKRVKLSLDFGFIAKDLELNIDTEAKTGIAAYSKSPTSSATSSAVSPYVDSNQIVWSDINSQVLDVEFELGYGKVKLDISSLTSIQEGSYGAFRDGGLLKISPALGSDARLITRIIDNDTGEDTPLIRDLKFRARVVGRESVDLLWGYEKHVGIGELPITISNNWQDYSFRDLKNNLPVGASGTITAVGGETNSLFTNVLGGSFASEGLYLRADRSSETAPSDDYVVEISEIRDSLLSDTNSNYVTVYSNDIKVIDNEKNDGSFMPTFKVYDAEKTAKLPTSIAVYDENGKVRASPNYETLTGKFHGLRYSNIRALDAPDNGEVWALQHLANGKLLVGGSFTSFGGVPANRLVRLNADGSLDPTFNIGDGFNNDVESINVDSSGLIYVTGLFTFFDNNPRRGLARLLDDGSIDASFGVVNDTNWTVYGTIIQSDGKLIVFGNFNNYLNNFSYEGIMRFNTNGSVDGTFAHTQGSSVIAWELSNDRIFTGDAVLDANGTELGSFTNSTDIDINRVAAYGDNILISGLVTPGNGDFTSRCAVIDESGNEIGGTSLTFNNTIRALAEIDGDIFVFGTFSKAGALPRNRAAKISIDGEIDINFAIDGGFDGSVNEVSVYENSMFIGGSFNSFNGITSTALIELNKDGVFPYIYCTQALSEISKITTGNDYISTQIPALDVAIAFKNQRPLIDWIDDIASSCDLVYQRNSETQKLDIARRFDGQTNPQQFRIYENELKINSDGSTINRTRTTPNESGYIVSYYDRDSDDNSPKDQVSGSIIEITTEPPKTINSYVVQKKDAQYLANRDFRDVYGKSEYSATILGLGHGLKVGQVGFIYTSKTNGQAAEISSINEQLGSNETRIVVNVYNMRRDKNEL